MVRFLIVSLLICIWLTEISGQCDNQQIRYPSTISNVAGGGTSWANITSGVFSSNDGYAAIVETASSTKILSLSGFNFALPTNAIVTGVELHLSKSCDDTTCVDALIQLEKGTGNIQSNDLASATPWPNPASSTITYGGCTLWGFSTLTKAEVENAGFKVFVDASNGATTNFRIDMVELVVFYTLPITSAAVTPITSGSGSTTATPITSGSAITSGATPITSGDTPITSGVAAVTTSVAPATTGVAVTTGVTPITSARITSGTRLTSGAAARPTTGSASISTTSVATSTAGERSGSTDSSPYIIYGVLGGVGFILIVVIVVLLFVYVKRRGSNNRERARKLGLPRTSGNEEEMNNLEAKRELPDVDEKDLPVDVHKIVEKITKLDKPIDFPGANGYSLEFNYVEKQTAHHGATEDYSTAHAEANYLTKNRFRNVLPPEKTRVKLATIEGVDGSDYINANYLNGLVKGSEKAYIATQGPLPSTINDFWRMVWEQNTSVVLNLTREFENGRQKSERYWPEGKFPYETADFSIATKEEVENYTGELITRKLALTKKAGKDSKEETRIITQFHYVGWPDHGVPEHTDAYIQLAEGADSTNTTNGPIVVHCSAGIGRTGTFITIHSLLELIKEKLKEDKSTALVINISEVIIKLREQRSGMVQTPEQYEFTYHAIRDVIEMYLDPKKKEDKDNERKKLEKERAAEKQKAKDAEAAKEKEAEAEKEKEKEKDEEKKEEKKEKEPADKEKRHSKKKKAKDEESQSMLHSTSSSQLNESTKSTDSTGEKKEKPSRPPRPPKKNE